MSQKIIIENIKIHTNHGCLTEEEKIGSDYSVKVEIHADLEKSAQSDSLSDTIDYVAINKIVHEEMFIRSKLLETVANRILNRFNIEFSDLIFAEVQISKLNPPMGGNVEKVTVVFNRKF